MSVFAKRMCAIIVFSLFFTLMNYNVTLQRRIEHVESKCSLEDMRSKINNEWANEIFYQQVMGLGEQNKDILVQQGKIEGVLDYMNHEGDYQTAWHSGYERGLNQTEDYAEMEYERGYHSAMKDVFPEHPIVKRPRPVVDTAIKTPDFDDKVGETLPIVESSVESINKKASELFNTKDK